MSLYQFQAKPAQISDTSKRPHLLYNNAAPKKKYRNLMHDAHVIRGITLHCTNLNPMDSLFIQTPQDTLLSKFKRNAENECTASSVDLKLQAKLGSTVGKRSTGGAVKVNRLRLAEESGLGATEQLVLTPRAAEGHIDRQTMTDEYLETLTDKFPQREADVQTEPLLSRCVKTERILNFVGADRATQVLKEDYLVDFDDQIESVIRALMNKALEQGRMEVLEEQELQRIRDQKRQDQQQRLRLLGQLQRAQAREERLEGEAQKRLTQSQLTRSGQHTIHQKLMAGMFAKKFTKKLQAEVERELLTLRAYLEISEAPIWIEVLPIVEGRVYEALEQDQEHKAVVDRIFESCFDGILAFSRQNIQR